MTINNLKEKVYALLLEIPKGKVTTYGELARVLGNKGLSRAIGNALHVNKDPDNIPCFRVVNRNGELAKNFGDGGLIGQMRRLLADGIKVNDNKVDLNVYFYRFDK